ncbi:uncharacterized protein LTR77_010141 [Saxophila tyrrhenica]|uniref:BTB domain-containing protein n=1 Tax=Saxophila tyrrhenica TaxID=1690608 RepID=A0AAV9NZT5_9PEZI|nr:hypothetical protein LTR77_010141 [Saxophila tyrrhenica]
MVLVGPEQRKFIEKETELCATSSFFRSACQGGWKESTEKVIRLPEVDLEVFEICREWLKYGYVCTPASLDDELEEQMNDAERAAFDPDPAYAYLVRAYAFGNMISDTNGRLYETVPRRSGLHRLFRDLWIDRDYDASFSEYVNVLPPAFDVEIAVHCIDNKGKFSGHKLIVKLNTSHCTYHEHPPGRDGECEDCYDKLSTKSSQRQMSPCQTLLSDSWWSKDSEAQDMGL